MDWSPPGSSVHGILTYVCVYLLFRLFSLIGYYEISSRVPCAMQRRFSSEILSMHTKRDLRLSCLSVLTCAFFCLLQLQLAADRVSDRHTWELGQTGIEMKSTSVILNVPVKTAVNLVSGKYLFSWKNHLLFLEGCNQPKSFLAILMVISPSQDLLRRIILQNIQETVWVTLVADTLFSSP